MAWRQYNSLALTSANALSGINSDAMTFYLRLLCVLVTLLSFSATAQWAWVDKNGRKIFSDRAPPADIPSKSIFKQPGAPLRSAAPEPVQPAVSATADAPVAQAPKDAASSAKPSGIDPVLAERKKKEEQAIEAKRKTEQERATRLKADNCDRAKLAKKGLDSGVRMATTNALGERQIMDDAARQVESKRIQSIIDMDCK